MELLTERHDALLLTRYGALGVADEVFNGNALDGDRLLEGHEDTCFGAFIDGSFRNIFAFKEDLAGCDDVFRVAHDGIEQRRFAGAVGTHDDMCFACVDRQVEAFEDFFAFDSDVQAFYS